VGPDDNTDRFTYWPARAARGGTLIAPGRPVDPIQLIDVRDLAAFSLHCLEQRIMGVFNVVSEPARFTMGDLVSASLDAAQRLAQPTTTPRAEWIDAGFLAAQGVMPWSDMPVWVPSEGETAGFAATKVTRALAAGLVIRPMTETVDATLRWHLTRPNAATLSLKAGIAPDRERDVLSTWQASR
jgi:2'-hydroxyisoflavone reductase